MAVHPAPVHTGIVFVRQVGEHILSLPASIDFLGNTDHCTTLESEDFRVQTVEHILAALAGLEVDNAYVELEGQEIPAADGSAGMFVETIQQTGIVQQEAIRTHLKIIESITVGITSGLLPSVPLRYPRFLISSISPTIHLFNIKNLCITALHSTSTNR